MNKLLVAFLLFSCPVFSQTNNNTSGSGKHVVLISIDGFRPEMYQDKSWPTPNLQYLMKLGAYAKHMKSVFPAYTFPSHTAMLTGALPARSKVCYNQPKGSKGEWNWDIKYIKAPTIWNALHQYQLKTAAIMWPGVINGDIDYNLSEIWALETPDDRISETRKRGTKGLVDEIEINATGKLDSTNMSDGYFSLDDNASRMAAYVFTKYKPNFLALHFATVDGMEHEYGRDHDSVRLAIAADDRAIGNLLEAIKKSGLKDSTTIIIVGDHGFSTIHEVFRPNMLIKDISARFITAGGSAFLYRNENTSADDVAKIITDVKKQLNTLPKNKRKQFRIIERDELDKMGADSSAILALTAEPGLVFSGSMGAAKVTNHGPGTLIQQNPFEGVFVSTSGGHHGYDPNIPEMYTGFIAAGAGIKKGAVINELCVTDIAPLIAKLLGVKFPCPDGILRQGLLNDE